MPSMAGRAYARGPTASGHSAAEAAEGRCPGSRLRSVDPSPAPARRRHRLARLPEAPWTRPTIPIPPTCRFARARVGGLALPSRRHRRRRVAGPRRPPPVHPRLRGDGPRRRRHAPGAAPAASRSGTTRTSTTSTSNDLGGSIVRMPLVKTALNEKRMHRPWHTELDERIRLDGTTYQNMELFNFDAQNVGNVGRFVQQGGRPRRRHAADGGHLEPAALDEGPRGRPGLQGLRRPAARASSTTTRARAAR